jgi:AraC-like DNA-binding protein
MKHFQTITEYSKELGIKFPEHPHFDVRRFEENSQVINTYMPAFRHEFYFIAVRDNGFGEVVSGHNKDFPKGNIVYFNTPFQVQSWNIDRSWGGFYIIFSQEFLNSSKYFDSLLDEFPFLKIDESSPFEIEKSELESLTEIYIKIRNEYVGEEEDKFKFIVVHTLELLNMIKRLLSRHTNIDTLDKKIRSADVKLISRFERLIEASFCVNTELNSNAQPHSPAYYANCLNIHPNHLNKVVKSTTGTTALSKIHTYIIKKAKSELLQSTISSKEIAYLLHFSSPAKFSEFFKKHTGLTPISYRKTVEL